MFETDVKAAWHAGRGEGRVDMNDAAARAIRQALLAEEREAARRAILRREIALVVALVVIGWQMYLIVNAQRIFGC